MDVITEFINELIIYDYILFGAILAIFLIFIVVGILLRKKVGVALFFILMAFVLLTAGSFFGYKEMHEYLFKNSTSLISQKKLTYTNAVVVYATVTNMSKKDFQSCKITATAYKSTGNEIKDYIFRLKPIGKMSIIEYDIPKEQEREIKFIIEPFTYSKDYNITLGAKCR